MTQASAHVNDDTFVQLERLSRAAAQDGLRRLHAHLHEQDRFDSLAVHLLETGLRAWNDYDPNVAGGVSRSTYAYRTMRGYDWQRRQFTDGRLIDWLRRTVRDSRFEPDIVTSLTTDGDMPEHPIHESESVAAAAWALARTLDPYNARTLLDLIVPMVEEGLGIADAASGAGITTGEAFDRLDCLQRQLHDVRPVTRVTPTPTSTIIHPLFAAALGMEDA